MMKRSERGANLVEFAVITVFVLIPLFAGMADLGRALYAHIIITNAAREGARYGTRLPNDTANIRARVLNEIANSGAVPAVISIEDCRVLDPTREADLRGEGIRVAVECDFDPIFPIINDLTLRRSAIMKIEGPSWSEAPIGATDPIVEKRSEVI